MVAPLLAALALAPAHFSARVDNPYLPFVPGATDRVLLMNAYAHGAALLAATWFETGASVELIGGVDVAHADDLSFPVDCECACPAEAGRVDAEVADVAVPPEKCVRRAGLRRGRDAADDAER